MRAQVLAPDSHELVTGQDEQPLRHDDDDDDEAADMLEEGEEEEEGAMAVEAMLSQAGSEVGLARTLNKLVTKPRILVCTPSNAACDLLLEVSWSPSRASSCARPPTPPATCFLRCAHHHVLTQRAYATHAHVQMQAPLGGVVLLAACDSPAPPILLESAAKGSSTAV
jgi:hypothetical protein